jgi:hypothetical protein
MSRSGSSGFTGAVAPALVLIALALTGCSSSGGSSTTVSAPSPSAGSATTTTAGAPPEQLRVHSLGDRLPAPRSGEALAASDGGLLIIGGLDPAGVSTADIERFDPATGRVKSAGALSEPLHDLAAANAGPRMLTFGGGSATTVDLIQAIAPGGIAGVVGHLPSPSSDLAAVAVGNRAYALGGYDGSVALGDVVSTTDGRRTSQVATLPVPVRYAAVTTLGNVIYAFGGETSAGADTRVIQAIDLAAGKATVVGHLPEPISHEAGLVFGGTVWLAGGTTATGASNRLWRSDDGLAFERSGSLPAPRSDAGVAMVDGVGYLVGGEGANGRFDTTVVVKPG